MFRLRITKCQNKRNFSYISRNSLFSNALKACVNEVDNNQEKDEKSLKSTEKNIYKIIFFKYNYVLYILRAAMKVGLFRAIFFPLLLGMLNEVYKGVGFRHAIDDGEYSFSCSCSRIRHRALTICSRKTQDFMWSTNFLLELTIFSLWERAGHFFQLLSCLTTRQSTLIYNFY